MLLLEPIDLSGNGRCARLDPSVIGLHERRGRAGLAVRIVQKKNDIVMQSALVSLQCQRVVAT